MPYFLLPILPKFVTRKIQRQECGLSFIPPNNIGERF